MGQAYDTTRGAPHGLTDRCRFSTLIIGPKPIPWLDWIPARDCLAPGLLRKSAEPSQSLRSERGSDQLTVISVGRGFANGRTCPCPGHEGSPVVFRVHDAVEKHQRAVLMGSTPANCRFSCKCRQSVNSQENLITLAHTTVLASHPEYSILSTKILIAPATEIDDHRSLGRITCIHRGALRLELSIRSSKFPTHTS